MGKESRERTFKNERYNHLPTVNVHKLLERYPDREKQ